MENHTNLPLSPADEKLILQHREIFSKPVKIRLVLDDDPASQKMSSFCEQLVTLLPAIRLIQESADGELSGIFLSDNIHFMMVPTGKLLEAFLLALHGNETLAGQDMGVDAGELNARFTVPAILKIYVIDDCPYCGKAVPKGLFLAGAAASKVHIRIIDALMFPELAKSDKVKSAPATIMDDTFRWTGDFKIEEVIEMIAGRDPVQLGYDTLKMMISSGDAERVASLMDEYNTMIPAFRDLLTTEKWTERLGAMVAFEYLVEKNTALAGEVLDHLWEVFDTLDTAVMGDVLHLVGVLNQDSQDRRLKAVLEGEYPEVVRGVAGEVLRAGGRGKGREG